MRNWEREIINSVFKEFLNMQYNLTCGRQLYFSSEGSVPWIFIALKYTSSSVRFEPANLETNSKHANHHTTEDNYVTAASTLEIRPTLLIY
jgi:hypothetical protein